MSSAGAYEDGFPIPCRIDRCGGSASRFLVSDGAPMAYCHACFGYLIGVPLIAEITRKEYLRLMTVSEVMGS